MSISTTIAPPLIAWQRKHGRHHLPWQHTRDAYRIWLSEIMLQQTQVTAVIPYYQRFVERFPTVQSLAAAPIDEVMALWSGLGYYSRARNLHACAQRVMAEHGGVFPRMPEQLEALPGIGRSTAAAIAAFAYGVRAAILDGNVKRVFARCFGVAGWPGERVVAERLWTIAEAQLPDAEIEAYTQGLMDLGATVCTRGKPLCPACPLADQCVARLTGRIAELPASKPKRVAPVRETHLLVRLHNECVLVEKRPPVGIWGGLWSLPQFDDEADLRAQLPAQAVLQTLPQRQHAFTHFTLRFTPHVVLLQPTQQVMEADHRWLKFDEVAQAGLPAPIKKLLLDIDQTEKF